MIRYPYRCPNCEWEFTEAHPMGLAPSVAICPRGCHTQARRVIAMPIVLYKARGFTGAGRAGEGRVDVFRHKDGSPLTDSDKNRVPEHYEQESN